LVKLFGSTNLNFRAATTLFNSTIMEYRVNYQKSFGPDGTAYDQTITAKMSQLEFGSYNNSVGLRKRFINSKKVMSTADVNFLCYVRYLVKGKNHTTLTQRDDFVQTFKLNNDARILDRNTIILIKLSAV